MIIAVDFDGTLVENKFPMIGSPRWKVINNLKTHQINGDKIILWTCRDGDRLRQAVEYCIDELGLHFDAINENLDEIKVVWGNDTRKVYADQYWDDKAVIEYAL